RRLINRLPLPALRVMRGEAADGMVLSKAIQRYRPRAYPGQIKLIVPIEQPPDFDHDAAPQCWRALAGGGLEVRETPGNHTSMFVEPHIQVLAAQLRTYLEGVRTTTRHEPWNGVVPRELQESEI